MPSDVLPWKRYGLAIIAEVFQAHTADDHNLRQVAWTKFIEQTPARSTLHPWTEGLGAFVLGRPGSGHPAARPAPPIRSSPSPFLFRRQTCRRNGASLYLLSMPPWTSLTETPTSLRAGVRFGNVGTHTSRTIMLAELRDLLAARPAQAAAASRPMMVEPPRIGTRAGYSHAVLEDNVLGKDTAASRRGALQRLSELYGVDQSLPIFRVLRRLWAIDEPGRPLLALLCAVARDPLLRATAVAVLPLPAGTELMRSALHASIDPDPLPRFKPAILDKIARNTASSWAQSGHLLGRVRKMRRLVAPTPASTAFALWLGSLQGLAGDYLLETLWAAVLDAPPDRLFDCALEAKQLGLLRAVAGGGVREIDVAGLDPAASR